MDGVVKKGKAGSKGSYLSSNESVQSFKGNTKLRKDVNSFLLTEQSLVFNNKRYGPSIIMLQNFQSKHKQRHNNKMLSQSMQSKYKMNPLRPVSAQLKLANQLQSPSNRSISSSAMNRSFDKKPPHQPFLFSKKNDQHNHYKRNQGQLGKKGQKAYTEFVKMLAGLNPEDMMKTVSQAMAAAQKQ